MSDGRTKLKTKPRGSVEIIDDMSDDGTLQHRNGAISEGYILCKKLYEHISKGVNSMTAPEAAEILATIVDKLTGLEVARGAQAVQGNLTLRRTTTEELSFGGGSITEIDEILLGRTGIERPTEAINH